MKKGAVIRDVTTTECPWLSKDIKKGTVVFNYTGFTYNCIGKDGVAVSDKPNESPFYELPINAVSWE